MLMVSWRHGEMEKLRDEETENGEMYAEIYKNIKMKRTRCINRDQYMERWKDGYDKS